MRVRNCLPPTSSLYHEKSGLRNRDLSIGPGESITTAVNDPSLLLLQQHPQLERPVTGRIGHLIDRVTYFYCCRSPFTISISIRVIANLPVSCFAPGRPIDW